MYTYALMNQNFLIFNRFNLILIFDNIKYNNQENFIDFYSHIKKIFFSIILFIFRFIGFERQVQFSSMQNSFVHTTRQIGHLITMSGEYVLNLCFCLPRAQLDAEKH